MREIKFRAWDKVKNRYETKYDSVYLDDEGGIFTLKNIAYGGDVLQKENYIIEQYTGLKDKNGKEIYEGDIIKLGMKTYDDYYKPGDTVSVFWDSEIAGYTPFSTTHSDYDYINSEDCEIIGNIHENKDLLNE